jgi:hypothetical protein
MKHTEVVDWRVWKAAQVAADTAPLYPGGPAAKTDDHIYVVTALEDSPLGAFSFITPSPTSLALSVAIAAAREAARIRGTVQLERATQPGQSAWLSTAQLRNLYSYFEQCMAAVTFSYQAIEAWSNQVVEEAVIGTHQVKRKKSIKHWTGPEIERNCSTEEKVGTIIPELTKLATPKGSQAWERLTRLKDLRDSTIHLKSSDQYVRGKSSQSTLYSRLLAADPLEFPKTAIAIIKHFSGKAEGQEWLAGAEAQLAER